MVTEVIHRAGRLIGKNLVSIGILTSLAMGAVFIIFLNTETKIGQGRIDFESRILQEVSAPLGENLTYTDLSPPSSYLISHSRQPLGFIIEAATQEGYSGSIRSLVALHNNGSIIGIRVIEHYETPGLGDKIEARKSSWSEQFEGTSLNRTSWEVKKWEGDFDAITGATISSRAVIHAVEKALQQWKQTYE